MDWIGMDWIGLDVWPAARDWVSGAKRLVAEGLRLGLA